MSLEGSPAPDFTLAGTDGRSHSMADYAGRTLVIFFYPKDNTPGCTKEACGFRDLTPRLAREGVSILGVSRDSLASHQRFIGAFDLPFPLLTDPDAATMTAYQAYGEKVMYGKKTKGVIRSTVVIGPDGTIIRHWPRVAKAEAHPAEVAAFLDGR